MVLNTVLWSNAKLKPTVSSGILLVITIVPLKTAQSTIFNIMASDPQKTHMLFKSKDQQKAGNLNDL